MNRIFSFEIIKVLLVITLNAFSIYVSAQTGAYWSNVPHYNQDWQGWQDGDCLPNSAAQVLGFHDQQNHSVPNPWPRLIPKGCSSFESNPNGYNTTMTKLKDAMDWWNHPGKVPVFGWLWDAVGKQVRNAATILDPGANGWWVDDDEFAAWSNMTNQINSYGPMMFMVRSGSVPFYYGSLSDPSNSTSDGTVGDSEGHSMCMVGWYNGTKIGIDTRWVIVDMGWSGTSPAWINYDYSIFDDFYTVEIRTTGTPNSTDPLDTPTGISATDGSFSDRVQITWNSVSGATYYEIWRNTSNNSGSASKLSNVVGTTTFNDIEAIPETTYYYWIKAGYNCSGSSGISGFSSSNPGYRSCPIPSAPIGVTASDATYCDQVCISWNSVSGATSYDVYRGSTFITNTTNTSYCVPTLNTSSVQYCVRAKNNCGASSPSSCDYGYVKSAPSTPGAITGSTTVCQGESQTYSISSVTGATSYTWTLPSGWSGSSTSRSIPAIAGSTGGTIYVTANNSCGSSTPRTLNVSVTATSAQPGSITGSTTLCQGGSQTYSISSITGATSYTWTLPSGWSGSSTSTSITATPGASGGTISVTANNSCGSSAPRTLSVSVTAIPAQPGLITGQTTVCQGSSQTYSIIPVSGATSYTWTLPSGWIGTSTSSTINATIGGNSGTISVTADNSCGSSLQSIMSITVTALPPQPGAIAGSTTITRGSSQTYSISAVAGATSYTWTLPSGWSGSSTSTSITATAGVEALSGNISVAANNSCGSGDPNAINVIVSDCNPPAQLGSITGQTAVCQVSSQTYSITAVSGATSYTWTLPSGWSGSSTSTSITATAGASGGTISVTANNSCGSSAPRTLSVSVTATPAQPGAITGAIAVCQGSSQTYSISSVTEATSYTWTLPSGWSGSSTTTSISATAGSSGGTISVTANNSCGSSIPRTLSVSVNEIPATPTITQEGDKLISSSSIGNQWYNSTGLISGATGQTYTPPSNGNYYVTVTSNGCISSPSNTISFATGIEVNEVFKGISIYPNPSHYNLTIENNKSSGPIDFEFINSGGKVIYKSILYEKSIIDLAKFSSGIYYIRFKEDKSYLILKFIKE